MSNNPHNLTVGDHIFRVSTSCHSRQPEYRKIVKIGRKWAITENSWGVQEKVSLENLRADGGQYTSPAIYYLTEEKYKQEIEKSKIWDTLRNKFIYKTPGITLEQMREIAKILGMEV